LDNGFSFKEVEAGWLSHLGNCAGWYSTGVVGLCLQTVVALIDGYIWFWVLDNLKNRLEEESGKSKNSSERMLREGQDLNCIVRGEILLSTRAAFRCQCGCISHAECWEKHIVTSHCPSFTSSYVTLDSEFKPKEVMASPARDTVAKGIVAAPTRYLNCQYLSDIWLQICQPSGLSPDFSFSALRRAKRTTSRPEYSLPSGEYLS
jgi:hypothetical protein